MKIRPIKGFRAKGSVLRKHKKRTFAGAVKPTFHFASRSDGFIVFFQRNRQFTWEPLAITQKTAQKFCDEMNRLRGKDIETIGRPLSQKFYDACRRAIAREIETELNEPAGRNPGDAEGENDSKENTGGETRPEIES